MTHTQKIIQDAIEGGYSQNVDLIVHISGRAAGKNTQKKLWLSYLFLDPSFWKAVIRHRDTKKKDIHCRLTEKGIKDTALKTQHQFIDHLADGDDYETALSKLN